MNTNLSASDFTAVELALGAGEMTPLHVHRSDETFRVLEGEVTIHVGGHVVRLGPGATYRAPGGTPHAVEAPAGPARYVTASQVHDVIGYRDFQRATSVPDALPAGEDHAVVAELARANEITVLGPPGALPGRLAA